MSKRSVSESRWSPPPQQPQRPGRLHAKYVDVDRLQNSSQLLAVISQRWDGKFTFALFRLLRKVAPDGVTILEEKTQFCPAELGQAYLDLVTLTLERIENLKKNPDLLPFAVHAS